MYLQCQPCSKACTAKFPLIVLGLLPVLLSGFLRDHPTRAQAPTVLLLNTALVGCIVSLCVLLALALSGAPALVPHVAFLLALAVGLLVLINWRALDSLQLSARTFLTHTGWAGVCHVLWPICSVSSTRPRPEELSVQDTALTTFRFCS